MSQQVLYISFDQLDAGKGADIHISKFAEALQACYQLTLITIGVRDRETGRQQARWLEFGLPAANLLDRIGIFRSKLSAHLRQHRYQVIQFRSIWEGRIVTEQAGDARLIYEVNGLPSIELKYHYPRLSDAPDFINRLRQQELAALLAADRIITPSQVTGQYLNSLGIIANKIQVIPNGVDLDLFRPPSMPPENDPIELIYIGTQAPWQGLETMLAALASVHDRMPMRLTIIGRARKEWLRRHQELAQSFNMSHRITFIESLSQTEIAARLAQADIALAPLAAVDRNLAQGCSPIKLFEYAACARPIIAADIAAVREIFTDNENILLYPPDDVAALAHQMLKLASDRQLRSRLGQAARQLIAAKYSWQQAQQALNNVYRELLSE